MLTENAVRGKRTTIMHLMQNAETVSRLVAQGESLLKSFHAEYDKDPAGCEAEFLRGDLAGWRDTLHTLYHDCAEEIVDRVLANTSLAFPETLVHSSAPREARLMVNGQ
jgi:hypothetical protein